MLAATIIGREVPGRFHSTRLAQVPPRCWPAHHLPIPLKSEPRRVPCARLPACLHTLVEPREEVVLQAFCAGCLQVREAGWPGSDFLVHVLRARDLLSPQLSGVARPRSARASHILYSVRRHHAAPRPRLTGPATQERRCAIGRRRSSPLSIRLSPKSTRPDPILDGQRLSNSAVASASSAFESISRQMTTPSSKSDCRPVATPANCRNTASVRRAWGGGRGCASA